VQVEGPQVDPACFRRLKPNCEESLSNFSFNCKLRRYTKDGWTAVKSGYLRLPGAGAYTFYVTVGRCRVTPGFRS
jgi:hypothetical protein